MERLLSSKLKGASLSNAANAYQWGVINGLWANNANFAIISYPMLPCFPLRYKDFYTPQGEFFMNGKPIGEMKKYFNLLFFRDYSIKFRLKHNINKWLRENVKEKNERIVLLTYTPSSNFISACLTFKKKYPNLCIASIVTELVDFTYMSKANKSLPKQLQQAIERKKVWKLYNKIDKFILLTRAMEERIPQAIGRDIIVEGIYSADHNDSFGKQYSEIKTLVYTGALQEYVGIRELVDAFIKTKNPKFRLVICGGGACAKYIKNKAEIDARIVYRGIVEREIAIREQKRATALINPRKPSEDFTKYSFPSKTMEYLASGTPMIGYKLPGMPDEYLGYFFMPKDLSIDSLSEVINDVLTMDSEKLSLMASRAKDFILQSKTAKKQIARIIDFLSK